jgi:serine/threonine protein kinase
LHGSSDKDESSRQDEQVKVEVGEVLADKYRVESVLGQGGMGYVVAANHSQLDRRVAIKFLSPEFCENEDAVARFLREARACCRIQSEHVAKVLDVGMLDDGAPYMVMELLEGQDLAGELRARGMLSIEDAVDYILQVCEALAEAHALGIVHRDLKPANLFKTRRGDGSALVKVLDFGISKALASDDRAPISLTASHDLVGSPPYMSPEQVRRPKSVDVRTDIWSLGVILHEFLGGRAPFTADGPLSVLASVVSDPPESLRLLRPNLPEELYAVVARCLEKDPDHRFQEVLDLVEALAPCAPEAAKSAFSRITAIVRSAKHRAHAQAQPKSPMTRDVPTLASPAPSRSPRPERKKWRLRQAGGGWDPTSPAGAAPRSHRRLLVLGLAFVVGGIGTVMAQRSSDVPSRTEASDSGATESSARGDRENAIEWLGVPAAFAATVPQGSAADKAVANGVSERAARVSSETPSRSTHRAIRPKNIAAAPEPEAAPRAEPPAVESAAAPMVAKPRLDPLEGRH